MQRGLRDSRRPLWPPPRPGSPAAVARPGQGPVTWAAAFASYPARPKTGFLVGSLIEPSGTKSYTRPTAPFGKGLVSEHANFAETPAAKRRFPSPSTIG